MDRQVAKLVEALKGVGFWPEGQDVVEERPPEYWRGLVVEALPGLDGAALVAAARVVVALGVRME